MYLGYIFAAGEFPFNFQNQSNEVSFKLALRTKEVQGESNERYLRGADQLALTSMSRMSSGLCTLP